MAKRATKTIRIFTEKGFYNPETMEITGEKDGEVTSIPDILALLAKDGDIISISLKQEEQIDDIEDSENE